MRKDMFKIICERPRRGVGYYRNLPNGYRQAKRFKLDENLECLDRFSGVNKLPMYFKSDSWDRKEFNDYLSPLWRFIDKQIGRPWDDVYSEICENINLDSTTRRHVREHVDRHVEVNVVFNENGEPCNKTGYRYAVGLSVLYKGELYKDPNDGILKRWEGTKQEKKEEEFRRERFFDKDGKEYTPRYGWRRQGEFNPDGVTFKFEKTGESHKRYDGKTESWFKYYYVEVERVRLIFEKDKDGNDVRRVEVYKEKVKVHETASKADIKKYGLNN